MKPNLIFIALLLLVNAVLMAQKPGLSPKIDRYFDENEREISQKEFQKHDGREFGFSKFEFETDSCTLHVVERNPVRGKIGAATMNEIRALLERQDGVAVDTSKILVIQFFPGPNLCSGSVYKPFLKERNRAFDQKIAQLEGISSYYFHKKGANLGVQGRYSDWLPDETQILQRTFFWYDYPCGSFVVIAPDGEFFEKKGEYGPEYIFEAINILAGKPLFEKRIDRYFDEDGKEISQKEFGNMPMVTANYLLTVCETDSCTRHSVEKKFEHGKLSMEALTKIRQQLEHTPGLTFDPSKTMVVQFYTGNSNASFSPGGCSDDLIKYAKKLLDYSNGHPGATLLFLHKSEVEMGDQAEFATWQPDLDGAFEQAFFTNRPPCINLAVINPDGEYFSHKFEHDLDSFFASVKRLRKKNR